MLLVSFALAKDLRSHLGLGVYQPLDFGDASGSVTTLSIRYGLPTNQATLNIGIELAGGFRLATEDLSISGGGGLRVLFGLVAEDNMNLYGSLFGGYMIRPTTGFVRITPALSAEFFLFGLENLGFSVDWGLNLDLGSSVTLGLQPALGVRYYF
jgi:hypothetical protein